MNTRCSTRSRETRRPISTPGHPGGETVSAERSCRGREQPRAHWPNSRRVREALSRLEFLAVIDPVMTATARAAHLVLPCASFLGGHELWESSHISLEPRIGIAPKIFNDGGLPTHWEIWREIAVRMGHSDAFPWKTEEEAITFRLKALKLTYDDLRGMPEGYIYHCWTAKKYEKEGFNTDSGKVEIYSSLLEYHGYDRSPPMPNPWRVPFPLPMWPPCFPLCSQREREGLNISIPASVTSTRCGPAHRSRTWRSILPPRKASG
jgi:anaerobic selenocysteine-containing dehydrogenase